MADAVQTMISAAESQRGKPYIWGGNGPAGYDCSGLVNWAAKQAGFSGLPRRSQEMRNLSQQVPLNQIAPGDLVTFTYRDRRGDNPGPGNHVAIYAGSGNVVQASGSAVNIAPLDVQHVDRVIRLPGLGSAGGATSAVDTSSTSSTSGGVVVPATLRQAGYGVQQATDSFGLPTNPFDLPGFLAGVANGVTGGATGAASSLIPWDGLAKAAMAAVIVAGGIALVVVGGGIAVWPTARKGLNTASKLQTAVEG